MPALLGSMPTKLLIPAFTANVPSMFGSFLTATLSTRLTLFTIWTSCAMCDGNRDLLRASVRGKLLTSALRVLLLQLRGIRRRRLPPAATQACGAVVGSAFGRNERGIEKLEKLYNGNRRDSLEGRTCVPLFLLLSCIDCKACPLVGTWIKTNGHEVRPLWYRRAMPD